VAGLILISNGLQAGQVIPPPINSALVIPRFTATALYHKKLAADLQANEQEAMKKAETWARTVYAPALARRDSLTASERSAIIEQLRRFTGADSAMVDQKTLTISGPTFTNRLLMDRNIELGRYDMRTSMPRSADTAAWQPTTDPSLRPVLDLMLGTSVPLIRYLRNELGFKSDLLYQGPFGEGYPGSTTFRGDWMSTRWGRGTADSSAGAGAAGRGGGRGRGNDGVALPAPLQTAMTLNTSLRVLVLGGLYDSVVPTCQSIDEAISRIDASIRPRFSARCYVGGHMMYSDKLARAEMKRDVAAFIRSKGR
jgi:carboxypeptidase C (cathepsin A)